MFQNIFTNILKQKTIISMCMSYISFQWHPFQKNKKKNQPKAAASRNIMGRDGSKKISKGGRGAKLVSELLLRFISTYLVSEYIIDYSIIFWNC